LVNVQAIAPTATSTLFIRQRGSNDGVTYYDIATTSATLATTSIDVLPVKAVSLDMGTVTTTVSYITSTYGWNFTHFIIWSEGWTGHLDTGVQAFIEVINLKDIL